MKLGWTKRVFDSVDVGDSVRFFAENLHRWSHAERIDPPRYHEIAHSRFESHWLLASNKSWFVFLASGVGAHSRGKGFVSVIICSAVHASLAGGKVIFLFSFFLTKFCCGNPGKHMYENGKMNAYLDSIPHRLEIRSLSAASNQQTNRIAFMVININWIAQLRKHSNFDEFAQLIDFERFAFAFILRNWFIPRENIPLIDDERRLILFMPLNSTKCWLNRFADKSQTT